MVDKGPHKIIVTVAFCCVRLHFVCIAGAVHAKKQFLGGEAQQRASGQHQEPAG